MKQRKINHASKVGILSEVPDVSYVIFVIHATVVGA